ncbi:MAG: AI-2E family transporter, partial [Candidatus Aminicenantes bacterium]|nr:AI-2E family transporter [Candidatus Aminicenantes bacterium]
MNRKNDKIGGQAIVLLVGALIAFVVLLLFIEDVISPFIAFAAVFLFLWPIRHLPLVKYVFGVVSILFLIWFFIETRGVLTPFLLSLILAYLFNPLVSRLEKYRFPRWLSSLMILLLVLSVVT